MTDQRPIGFWIKLLDRLIDERFAETLEEHGVTRQQWQLLNVLSSGGATVSQLNAAVAPFLYNSSLRAASSDDLHADDAGSALDHLSELIESGWVDATRAGYELTARGQTAVSRLSAVVATEREHATDGLTPDEDAALMASMERIARNLGWDPEAE